MLGRQLKRIHREESGFTIIELLIATAVFTVLLLIITTGIIRFTAQYYKGVTASATQNTAQTIVDTVSQDIQFTPGGATNSIVESDGSKFCVGGHLYEYQIGKQVSDTQAGNQAYHALIENTAGNSCGSTPADITSQALPIGWRELVGKNMRLANLDVSSATGDPSSNLYSVKVRVVYGDDDLLCSPSASDCNEGDTTNIDTDISNGDLSCKVQTGSQFCAVSELSTNVQKRL